MSSLSSPPDEKPEAPPVPNAEPGEPLRITATAQFEKINLKPDVNSPVIGLFRAGQSVRVKGDGPIPSNEALSRCSAGWFAIEPRGYVCPGFRSTQGAPNIRAMAAAEALPDGSSVMGVRV